MSVIDYPDLATEIFTPEVFLQTLDKVNDGVILTDPNRSNNPIIYASSGFYELTGYAAHEVLGKNCGFLQGQGTSQDTINEIKRSIAEKIAFRGKILNYKKSGEPFINLLRIEPIFVGDSIKYFLGSQTDYLV